MPGILRRGFLALAAAAAWLIPAGADANDENARILPLAEKSLLLDGDLAGSRIVVVGERGHILTSDDGGESWTQSQVPTRMLLTAVHMLDEQLGWAVGHDAIVLRTDDGGGSWRIVHAAPEEELPLLDVWFRDRNSGLAVGAHGYMISTEDGGETWELGIVDEEGWHLNRLISVGEGGEAAVRLFIAAEAGTFYRSDDAGANWSRMPSPYEGSWFGGLAMDEDLVLLAGLRGNLHLTGDGGRNWKKIETGTQAMLTDVVRLPSGTIVVTGLDGTVLVSRDGGGTVETSNLPTRKGISAALPLPNDGVLLIGEFGTRRLALD